MNPQQDHATPSQRSIAAKEYELMSLPMTVRHNLASGLPRAAVEEWANQRRNRLKADLATLTAQKHVSAPGQATTFVEPTLVLLRAAAENTKNTEPVAQTNQNPPPEENGEQLLEGARRRREAQQRRLRGER
jgi:hypothetical protein